MLQSNFWWNKTTLKKKKKFRKRKTGAFLCISIMMENVTTWRVQVWKKVKLFIGKEMMMLPPSSLQTENWLDQKETKLLLNAAKVKLLWTEISELRFIQMIPFMLLITKTILFTMMSPNSQIKKWKMSKKNSTSTLLMIALLLWEVKTHK